MSDSPALTDDEALWFPVHMNAGDSFSHTVDNPGDVGDGIGLPNRGGPRPPKKPGIRASSWLWLSLWGLAAVGIVTVAARKDIAAVVTQNWLKSQGVDARLKFDKLSLSHLSGHIVIGDPAHPEASIDNFDADYSLSLFGGGQPLARIKSLHLVHPVISLALKGNQLDYGSLNKLVHDSLSAPPSNAPPPDSVIVDDAQVRLVTDYGVLNGTGGLSLDNGRLSYLTLKVPAAHLSGPLGQGDVTGGTLNARAVHSDAGDQLSVQAALGATAWDLRGASPVEAADPDHVHLQGVAVTLDARLPYHNATVFTDSFSGATEADVAVKAAGVDSAAAKAGNLEASLHLDGQTKISDKGESFDGTARLLSRADSLDGGGIAATDLKLAGQDMALKAALNGVDLSYSLDGPLAGDVGTLKQGDLTVAQAHLDLGALAVNADSDGLNATFKGGLTAGHLASGDIGLDATTMSLDGLAHSDTSSGQWSVALTSDIASDNGHYKGLNAVAKGQAEAAAEFARKPPVTPPPGVPAAPPPGPDSVVAIDRALSRFSLRVSKLAIGISGVNSADGAAPPQFDIRLQGGAQAALTGGGKATLTPAAGQPFLSSRQPGAFNVAVDGPDLPKVALAVTGFGLDRAGSLGGAYALTAGLNAFPATGVAADAHGHFAMSGDGTLRVSLDAPATFSVAAAEIGDHLETITGTLTQTGDAFLVSSPTAWRVDGAFHGVSLKAPNEIVAVTGAEGTFQAFSIPGSDITGMKAQVTAATVADAMPADQVRFNPLVITGSLTQDSRAMTGRFLAATPKLMKGGKPAPVADIALDSDPVSGKGAVTVDTRDYLTFDAHGLQPVFLSPTVAAIFSKDVSGKAAFKGGFNFDKDTSASSGTLTLDGLNFTGAAGVSQGLNGQIVFTSLTPLLSEPHQMLSIDHMQLGVPLDKLELRFQFLADHLAVEQADVQSPGGPVLLQPMTVPFDGVSPISGTMTFDGLDFGKIIATTGLKDSMNFTGTVSGKLPFTVAGGHVSFIQGFLASDASGTISIKRQALTGVQASGSVSSPDTKAPAASALPPDFNPFQDLAYQALEHITYDRIDAKINSIQGGVLDVNFHIKGYFDPPQPQKARISLFDYISGKWMQKPIKLPSKTPVELFLDVPVNLDDILNDLTAFNVRTAQKPQ